MDIDGRFYCPKCMRELEEDGACPFCGYSPKGEVSPAALSQGTLLNGRYQLGAVIGQGGFGITYAAWDEILGTPVAIKEYFPADYAARNTVLSDDVETPESSRAIYLDGLMRFQRESHLLAELQGIPEVVKVLDFFSENNTGYIAMEFVRGMPVDEWVKEKKLTAAEVLALMRPAIDALVATHRQGVMHRDLTPSNILVREDGTVKLIDFGSAAELERSKGTVVLTRKYAPIEQYGSEHGAQGPWTDVYGISAVIYTLICGLEPQEAVLRVYDDKLKSPKKQKVQLKKYQNDALMAGLQVKPENRIQSMDELRSRLYNLPLPEMLLRQKRFIRRVSIIAAVLLALAAVIAANFSVGLPLGRGLLYSLRSDGWHVKGEMYEQKELIIPETRLGIKVSRIDEGAFREDSTLETVTVAGSVKEIGDSAFYGCGELKDVTLEEGVQSLGTASFAECDSLATVQLPQSLTEITDTSFYGSSDSAALVVHNGSPSHIWAQNNDVGYTSGLDYEVLDDGTVIITAVDDTDGRLTLPSYIGNKPVTLIADDIRITKAETVILPRYLVEIPERLFADYSNRLLGGRLKNVYIGEYVERIGASAFYNCSSLKRVTLPEALTSIGDNAFFCSGLEELELPQNVRYIGDLAFSQTHISSVTIPEGVTAFGNDAFSMIGELNHVDLPESLTELPDRAFYGSGLKSLRLPNNLKAIGEYAFWNSDLECLVIPDSVEEIGGGCFMECRNLRCVYMNLHKEIYYNSQFFLCKRSVYICGDSDSIAPEFALASGCIYVDTADWNTPDLLDGGTAAWYGATAPETLTVPFVNIDEGVMIVDTYIIDATSTGQDCMLREITLSPFQTEIDDAAFFWCRYLEKVKTEGEILSIGQQAFEFCMALNEVPIKNALYIYSGAFTQCRALRTVTLSDDIIYLDSNAFMYCNDIEVLNVPRLAD
ncbi:MAG: leucine-rich repeat protein [Clostridia bacterium]|nr:leucine-rich repeat protein [Clostridia bacterium]